MDEIPKIDRIDRKILAALEKDARTPVSQIAKAARTSRTVAEYRINEYRRGDITNLALGLQYRIPW